MLLFRHMVVGDTPQIFNYSLSPIAHVGVTAQSAAHSRLQCGMRARACCVCAFTQCERMRETEGVS
jgi:hypothetical protein